MQFTYTIFGFNKASKAVIVDYEPVDFTAQARRLPVHVPDHVLTAQDMTTIETLIVAAAPLEMWERDVNIASVPDDGGVIEANRGQAVAKTDADVGAARAALNTGAIDPPETNPGPI